MCFPFLVLGLWPSFLGNPKTKTVSHSFPKLSAALQRKFGTNAAYRADGGGMFGFVRRERITANGTVLGSASAMPQRLPNREGGRSLGVTHRT
jgi:hypothetical protein